MPDAAIETQQLSKAFAGHMAVDGLSLCVPKGSVFGFLGPNGAGKTTTLRMLVGLARPTSGRATVLGQDILRPPADPRQSYLRRIGFLPDVPEFYSWMRAGEFLTLAGQIFGLSGRNLRLRVEEVLQLTGLAGVKTRIGGFSRGMKQRLGLAQALINKPELLFLDEPTSALDPMGRKETLEAIAALAGQTTIFFSTHILSDAERVCDTVAILNKGRLVTQQSIRSLRQSHASHWVYLEVEGGQDGRDFIAAIRSQPWVDRVEVYQQGWRVLPRDLATAQHQLPALLAAHNLALRRFELQEPSLEDIFVELIHGKPSPQGVAEPDAAGRDANGRQEDGR